MNISSDAFKQIQKNLNIQFQKMCSIKLIPDANGNFIYFPQRRYVNSKGYSYLKDIDENTEFCKFRVQVPMIKGVYLWVVENEIVYLGEGGNLNKRFNVGYGNISPRNCFKGGQSTNIKMNRFALKTISAGKNIDIYMYETHKHKQLEKELLRLIDTPYNVKNNSSNRIR